MDGRRCVYRVYLGSMASIRRSLKAHTPPLQGPLEKSGCNRKLQAFAERSRPVNSLHHIFAIESIYLGLLQYARHQKQKSEIADMISVAGGTFLIEGHSPGDRAVRRRPPSKLKVTPFTSARGITSDTSSVLRC